MRSIYKISILLILILTSCKNKVNVKEEANKYCVVLDKYYQAEQEHNEEKMKELLEERRRLLDEITRKFDKNEKLGEEFNKYLDQCVNDLMRKYHPDLYQTN